MKIIKTVKSKEGHDFNFKDLIDVSDHFYESHDDVYVIPPIFQEIEDDKLEIIDDDEVRKSWSLDAKLALLNKYLSFDDIIYLLKNLK